MFVDWSNVNVTNGPNVTLPNALSFYRAHITMDAFEESRYMCIHSTHVTEREQRKPREENCVHALNERKMIFYFGVCICGGHIFIDRGNRHTGCSEWCTSRSRSILSSDLTTQIDVQTQSLCTLNFLLSSFIFRVCLRLQFDLCLYTEKLTEGERYRPECVLYLQIYIDVEAQHISHVYIQICDIKI